MQDKAKINYPCEWEYCVFGTDKEKLRKAIKESTNNENIEITPSKSHKSYHSKKFKVYVGSEEERNGVYEALKNHPDIKFVL